MIDVGVLCNSGRIKDTPEEFKVNWRFLCLNLDFGPASREMKVRSEFLVSQLVRPELHGVPVGVKVPAQLFV